MERITIDAQGKKIGRIASEAASCLMGKRSSSFARNKVAAVAVSITNAGKLDLPERKRAGKIYRRYSGYPGGLAEETLASLIARKGAAEALRHAVRGMLPKNKLRPRMLKNLAISE